MAFTFSSPAPARPAAPPMREPFELRAPVARRKSDRQFLELVRNRHMKTDTVAHVEEQHAPVGVANADIEAPARASLRHGDLGHLPLLGCHLFIGERFEAI